MKLAVCSFCRETADVEFCDSATKAFVRVPYCDVHIGEKVRRAFDKTLRPPATVREIAGYVASVDGAPIAPSSFALDPFYQQFGVMVVEIQKANGQLKRFTVNARSPVAVLRDGICGVPCCWRHRCERGPGATFCADHWKMANA